MWSSCWRTPVRSPRYSCRTAVCQSVAHGGVPVGLDRPVAGRDVVVLAGAGEAVGEDLVATVSASHDGGGANVDTTKSSRSGTSRVHEPAPLTHCGPPGVSSRKR